jgi:predicted O-linked N-acetylglucosamine transferase (SPINDLY family)
MPNAQKLKQALALQLQGQCAPAQALYEEILRTQPEHFEALRLLAVIAAQSGHPIQAAELIGRAIAAQPNHPLAFFYRASVLHENRQLEAAVAGYSRAIELDPGLTVAYMKRGVIHYELERWDAALADYTKVTALDLGNAEAQYNRAVLLERCGQLESALSSYERAIELKPDHADAHYNRGNLLYGLERWDEALASFDQALAARPDFAQAYINRGAALTSLQQFDAALASYDRAITLKADSVEVHSNHACVLREVRQWDAALASYDRAIELDPGRAMTHYNRGNLLQEMQKFDPALASYDRALEIDPDYVEAYANRGQLLCQATHFELSIASFDEARARNPDYHFLAGLRRNATMQICDWNHFDEDMAELAARVDGEQAAALPYYLLAGSGSARLQRKAAEIWVRETCPWDPSLPEIARWAPHEKIRIGYFSPDFWQHPVSILAVELFEIHDRACFEITAFSFGPAQEDAMRARLAGAFDHFLDVSGRSDREIALLARELQIDIAVDLCGFTRHCRPGIFAQRAAPVQVSFLGYSGTMGAPYMDYLIADPTLIPEASRPHYREQILYLPDNVLPHDSKQSIAAPGLTRRQAGLPDVGFVFCCFNAVAKITPHTFAGWMRILARVPGSVLWLSAANPTAQRNLRREAADRGVVADRLIFAPRLASLAAHLARHRAADLFLDTLPYNAHTTASDALWAGLPVLTQLGETYAGRVAASLLTAIGLPELITSTQDRFEALAIELAADPVGLAHLRERLAQNRLTTPLFDTRRYARDLEAGYDSIHARYQSGMPPEDLWVTSSPAACRA